MKKLFFLTFLIIISTQLFSQQKLSIGIDGALSKDIYQIFDTGENAFVPELFSNSFGLFLRYNIKNSFFIESGLIIKNYSDGYGLKLSYKFENNETWGKSYGYSKLQIPIRIDSKIPFYNNKIALISRIGYHFCINKSSGGVGSGNGSGTIADSTYTYSTISNIGDYKKYSLLETGIGLEFNFIKNINILCMASYYTGFKDLIITNMKYKLPEKPEQQSKIVSSGNYFNFSLGFRYSLGQKKE